MLTTQIFIYYTGDRWHLLVQFTLFYGCCILLIISKIVPYLIYNEMHHSHRPSPWVYMTGKKNSWSSRQNKCNFEEWFVFVYIETQLNLKVIMYLQNDNNSFSSFPHRLFSNWWQTKYNVKYRILYSVKIFKNHYNERRKHNTRFVPV